MNEHLTLADMARSMYGNADFAKGGLRSSRQKKPGLARRIGRAIVGRSAVGTAARLAGVAALAGGATAVRSKLSGGNSNIDLSGLGDRFGKGSTSTSAPRRNPFATKPRSSGGATSNAQPRPISNQKALPRGRATKAEDAAYWQSLNSNRRGNQTLQTPASKRQMALPPSKTPTGKDYGYGQSRKDYGAYRQQMAAEGSRGRRTIRV